MSLIYVQPLIHETFSDFVDFAEANKFNLEIATFAYANVFDTDWQKVLHEHEKKISPFKGKLSFHGAYQDVLVHSIDNKISEISKARVLESLEVARKLNATKVVFHSNYNPLVKDNYFRKNWVEKNAAFWSEILKKYEVTILLENIWELTPQVFEELFNDIKSPRLKICLDIGHLNVYSKVPFHEWAGKLGSKISYIHVSDNCGERDEHAEVGKGKIDWQEFTKVIEECQMLPEIVLEQTTLEKTQQSLSFMEKNRIYPFNKS
jgi:sugar phosphate isomerase/epimerase